MYSEHTGQSFHSQLFVPCGWRCEGGQDVYRMNQADCHGGVDCIQSLRRLNVYTKAHI